MVLKINGLALSLGEGEELLPARAASLLGVPREAVSDLRVIRRSIDARRSRPPRFIYLLSVRLPEGLAFSLRGDTAGIAVTKEPDVSPDISDGRAGRDFGKAYPPAGAEAGRRRLRTGGALCRP